MNKRLVVLLKLFLLGCQVSAPIAIGYIFYIPLSGTDAYWKHPEFLWEFLPFFIAPIAFLCLIFYAARILYEIVNSQKNIRY